MKMLKKINYVRRRTFRDDDLIGSSNILARNGSGGRLIVKGFNPSAITSRSAKVDMN
jgi:hypothetical protein